MPRIDFAKPLWLKVFMSNKFVYAQVVHSPTATTLCAATSFERKMREELGRTGDCNAAEKVGLVLAQRLLEQDIRAVAWDMPAGKRYHGKMKALLDGVTKGGVKLI